MNRSAFSLLVVLAGGLAAGCAAGLGALLLIGGASPPQALPAGNGPAATAGNPAAAAVNAPAGGPGTVRRPPPGVDMALVEKTLAWAISRLPGKAAVHLRIDDGTPEGVSRGVLADTPMPAASVIKLPLMVMLHNAWRSGFLERTPADEKRLREMMVNSDNPSADALIDRLGFSQAAAWLKHHGYRASSLRFHVGSLPPDADNTVSAAEMTRMLLAIARGEMLEAGASAEMRELLLAQSRRTRIPRLLPGEARVGNKTGTWRGAVNDVAFIEPPTGPRYALAVLLDDARPVARAEVAIAELSRELYRAITARPSHP